MTEQQREILDAVHRGVAIRAPELLAFVRGLAWPRFFLDFVTTRCAEPPWAGTRPQQLLPVQWACTLQWMPGVLGNLHFLYDGEAEPQRAFAEALIAALCQPCDQPLTQVPPGVAALSRVTQDTARRLTGWEACHGPILAYDGRFEQRILRELARALPDLAPALEGIGQRILDLGIFLRAWYYHPAQGGSWSLQAVAPTLDPHIRYGSLAIPDDAAASAAWRELLHPETPAERQAQLRSDLVDYAGQNTWSLVKMLNALQQPPVPAEGSNQSVDAGTEGIPCTD